MPPGAKMPPAAKGEEGLLLEAFRFFRLLAAGARRPSTALQPARRLKGMRVAAPDRGVFAVEARREEDDGVFPDQVRPLGRGDGGVLGDADGHLPVRETHGFLIRGAQEGAVRRELAHADDHACLSGRGIRAAGRDGCDFFSDGGDQTTYKTVHQVE